MNLPPSQDQTLPEIIELLTQRLRQGEEEAIDELIARFPQFADEIDEILPVLRLIEQSGSVDDRWGSRTTVSFSVEQIASVDDFRIKREIARGGMGVVYEAEQLRLGRRIALKVLPPQLALDPRYVERFHREARAAARLHHSNIVPVFGTGEDKGIKYYTMQLIDGSSLEELLQHWRAGKGEAGTNAHDTESRSYDDTTTDGFDQPATVDGPLLRFLPTSPDFYRTIGTIAYQVADALACIHTAGLLHRDIKPSNVLLDSKRTAWVSDLGLAKLDGGDELTGSQDLVGTLRYLAPERFSGAGDDRSDIYSAGVTLYELTTAQRAFPTESRAALVEQICRGRALAPRQANRHIPKDLATIISKATERDRDRRYQSAADLRDDLRRFLDDEPIRARHIGPIARLWRLSRRHPVSAALVTSVILLLCCLSIVALQFAWATREYSKSMAAAERHSQQRLAESLRYEALYWRDSGRAGQQVKSLQCLEQAVALLPRLALPSEQVNQDRSVLRDQAINAMAIPDLAPRWSLPHTTQRLLGFDKTFSRFATRQDISVSEESPLTIRRVNPSAGESPFELGGHGFGTAHGVCWSPDGQWLAAQYQHAGRNTMVVWNLPQQRVAWRVSDINSRRTMDISPDSQRLIVGTREGKISLFELASGRRLNSYEGPPGPQCVRFSPDGKQFAVTAFGTSTTVWDIESGNIEFKLPSVANMYSLSWHPDGHSIATAGSNRLIFYWHLHEPITLGGKFAGHDGPVVEVLHHPKGSLLASNSWDGTMRLWEISTGKEVLRADGAILCHREDGAALALSTERSGHIYDVLPACVRSANRPDGGVPMWDVDYSPDGRLLAVSTSQGTAVFDGSSLSYLASLPGRNGRSAIFTPSGDELITSGTEGVRQWPLHWEDERTRPQLTIGPPKRLASLSSAPSRLALNGDGSRLLIDQGNQNAALLTLDSGKRMPLNGTHGRIDFVAMTVDGAWALTSTWQGKGVKLWNAVDGELVRDLAPKASSATVCCSPDGRFCVVGTADAFDFWNVDGWTLHKHLPRQGTSERPGAIDFDPISGIAAAAVVEDAVTLMIPETGEVLATLRHPDPLTIDNLCFSPDGSKLAVRAGRRILRLWDLRQIRRRLQQMGLDWSSTPLPPARQVGSGISRITVLEAASSPAE